jgi:hypothetical protein
MRRNPQLSVRQPEATSLARAKGFNRDNILHYFDLSESNIAKFGRTFDKIFNVDERGFSAVQRRLHKIVEKEGKYEVGVVASSEQEVCVVSAAGVYIPPMTTFKAKKWNNAFEISALPRDRDLAS